MLRSGGADLSDDILQDFQTRLQGKVICKKSADKETYTAAISRWNMLHVKEANMIVFPQSEDDVAETIKFATKHNIDLAISAGRHTYSGASSGFGMVIDLREMRWVKLNREAKTITAAGGALSKDLEDVCEEVGLRIVMGTVNETGIGGITTGGGLGPLTGQYGMVCDNLLSARIALADGRIVTASENENQDLFWAIRGAGSNFGVCTEFTYQLHDSSGLMYSAVIPCRKEQWRTCVETANHLYENSIKASQGRLSIMLAYAALMGPSMHPAWLVSYDGPEDEARRLLEPVLAIDGAQAFGRAIPYPETTSFEALKALYGDSDRIVASSVQMPYPLHVDVIETLVNEVERVRDSHQGKALPQTAMVALDLRDYRKVAERPSDATAYAHRIEGCLGMVECAWKDSRLDEEMMNETREIVAKVRKLQKEKQQKGGVVLIKAEMDSGPIVTKANGHAHNNGELNVATGFDGENHEDGNEPAGQMGMTTLYALIGDGKEKMPSVFGDNLSRLRELKKKYDPDCIWNKWYPIEPAT